MRPASDSLKNYIQNILDNKIKEMPQHSKHLCVVSSENNDFVVETYDNNDDDLLNRDIQIIISNNDKRYKDPITVATAYAKFFIANNNDYNKEDDTLINAFICIDDEILTADEKENIISICTDNQENIAYSDDPKLSDVSDFNNFNLSYTYYDNLISFIEPMQLVKDLIECTLEVNSIEQVESSMRRMVAYISNSNYDYFYEMNPVSLNTSLDDNLQIVKELSFNQITFDYRYSMKYLDLKRQQYEVLSNTINNKPMKKWLLENTHFIFKHTNELEIPYKELSIIKQIALLYYKVYYKTYGNTINLKDFETGYQEIIDELKEKEEIDLFVELLLSGIPVEDIIA